MQVINYIILGASFVTAVTTICTFLKKIVEKTVKKAFEPIYQKIDELDKNQCKQYLVTFLKAKQRGEKIDSVEEQLAHEVYDRYKNKLHGNSYIGDEWVKTMK